MFYSDQNLKAKRESRLRGAGTRQVQVSSFTIFANESPKYLKEEGNNQTKSHELDASCNLSKDEHFQQKVYRIRTSISDLDNDDEIKNDSGNNYSENGFANNHLHLKRQDAFHQFNEESISGLDQSMQNQDLELSKDFDQFENLDRLVSKNYIKDITKRGHHKAHSNILSRDNKNKRHQETNIVEFSYLNNKSNLQDSSISDIPISKKEARNDLSVPKFMPQKFNRMDDQMESLNSILKLNHPQNISTPKKFIELIIYKLPTKSGKVAQINALDIILRSLDLAFEDFMERSKTPKILKALKTSYLLQRYQNKFKCRILQMIDFCDTNDLLEKRIRKAKHNRSKLKNTLMRIRTNRISLSLKINSMRLFHNNQISSLADLKDLDKFFSSFAGQTQLSLYSGHVKHQVLRQTISQHLNHLGSLGCPSANLKYFLKTKTSF